MIKVIKLRTASMNDRGQIVIPEDMRESMHLTSKDTLVLIEKGNQIVIRKESDIAEQIEQEEEFWKMLSAESMKRAWGKEDSVWDKIAKGEK